MYNNIPVELPMFSFKYYSRRETNKNKMNEHYDVAK